MKFIIQTLKLIVIIVFITYSATAQWSEDASSIYPTNADKKVGIGTTDPGTKLEVKGTATFGKTYVNVLTIGPLDSRPDYFYIDTKIPFESGVAPQIHITGYNYGNPNKAIKLTIGWYEYYNSFYWAQYKSDLGYYNPSRIRLGTYDDAGTKRVRIEIANDGTYWSSYFISATDHGGLSTYYNDWNFTLGNFPSVGTGDIITVSEYAGMVYSNTGNVGINTNTPISKLDVRGVISAGNQASTAGSTILQGIYGNGTLNNLGGVYSSGGSYLSYGVNQNGSNNWLSTTAIPVARSIAVLDDGFKVYTAPVQTVAVGSALPTQPKEIFSINNNGNIGIGVTNPKSKLAVNGAITAQKVTVTQTGWADYVFDKDYKLMGLIDLSNYINQHKHLPEIPSTKEIENSGIDVGTNQALLLKKIEELTLYIIEQHKGMSKQQKQIEALTKTVEELKQQFKN